MPKKADQTRQQGDTLPDPTETRLARLEQRLIPEVQSRQPNQYSPRVTQAQQARFLKLLEECGNPVTCADLVGIALRTVFSWRSKSQSFSKKYDESLAIGEHNIEHQLTGKMDDECLTRPYDKVTGVLAMFRTKKLNPQYRESPQLAVNISGPAAMQFVVSHGADASKQIEQAPLEAEDEIEDKQDQL